MPDCVFCVCVREGSGDSFICIPFLYLVQPESVMQGQVEIRGSRQGEEYVGWQMFLRGQKPADITAFIAVDDFR